MADEYIDPDVVIDSEELADLQFEYMDEVSDGRWTPAAGNLDTWTLEAGSRLGSEVATLALLPHPDLFRTFGTKVAGIPSIDATAATATSQWTLGDDDGHTIEAGTVVDIEGEPFEVVGDAVVPSGATIAAGVELVAVDEGSAGSGLSANPTLVDVTGYEAVIVLDAPTEGGQDGETPEDYLNRLAREEELSAPRPLNVHDVELFSRRVQGIDRTLVLDNYKPADQPNPGDPEDNAAELTFTIASIDVTGTEVSPGIMSVLLSTLKAARGTNWRIFKISPTYSTINVEYEVIAHTGFDTAVVREQVDAAINEFLSPANFGLPELGDIQRRWILTSKVYHRAFSDAVKRVESVRQIPVLKFNVAGFSLTENVDIDLPGKAPLTQPGDITGTVMAS